MFKKKFNPSTVDCVVGENTSFKGNIMSEGMIRVEGQVTGDVETGGDIAIGEKALVKGNLVARNVHLSGTVEGNITAKGILHLMSTSKLTGDIQVSSFVADEGGIFHGNCTMIDTSKEEGNKDSEKPLRKFKKSTPIKKMYNDKE